MNKTINPKSNLLSQSHICYFEIGFFNEFALGSHLNYPKIGKCCLFSCDLR